MKKIITFTFVFLAVTLNSCESKIEMENLYGKWKMSNDSRVTNLDETRYVTFKKDGKYKVEDFIKDSIVNSFEGTFEIDEEKKSIATTNSGWVIEDMTVTKLTSTDLYATVTDDEEIFVVTVKYTRE